MQENKAQKVIEEVKKAFIGKTECVVNIGYKYFALYQ